MEALTISEGFRRAIGSRTVVRAFFSTYCFEPNFFELEVLPLLLGNPGLSTNEAIRYEQLQSQMREHQNRFAVAYDVDVFNPELAPRLEVDYLPVRVDGACQHAKIAVLELFDELSQTTAIILAAGSFNLTKAGWWENIEVGHWVELTSQYAPSNIVNPLQSALTYFQGQHASTVLTKLLKTLSDFGETKEDKNCAFYFSGSGRGRLHFTNFIRSNSRSKDPIEIVSPFFAEKFEAGKEGANNVASFLAEFKSVSLLLPLEQDGKAPISPEVYKELCDLPVTWCQWRNQMKSSYGIPAHNNVFRKLHAKIYQCMGSKPWLFLGSVNLSHKAFYANVEAGFLLLGEDRKPMLIEIKDSLPIFSPPVDEALAVDEAESIAMPILHLVFDWQESSLQLLSSETGELSLYDSLGTLLLRISLEKGKEQSTLLPELKPQLERSSLIKGVWRTAQQAGEASRRLLISQRNLFCRRSELPEMGLQDLLRIFQDMNVARRTALIDELASRMIRLQKDGSMQDENLPPLPVEVNSTNFFSEFSQVNGAFWMLGQQLKDAKVKDQPERLAYYLKGCQPDSLQGVLKALQPTDDREAPSIVVRYLTLLSVDELLHRYTSDADQSLAKSVAEAILKTEDEITFDEQLDKARFLSWIKVKFKQPIADFKSQDISSGGVNAAY